VERSLWNAEEQYSDYSDNPGVVVQREHNKTMIKTMTFCEKPNKLLLIRNAFTIYAFIIYLIFFILSTFFNIKYFLQKKCKA